MNIFIDSADIDEIRNVKGYGILDGVTTNPSLIKRAVEKHRKNGKQLNMDSYIREMLKIAKGTPVSLEVIGSTYDEMVSEAKLLYKKFNSVAGNVCVKIPVNPAFLDSEDERFFDGIRAIKTLSRLKIPVNCTLVFTPEQALLAAKAGARFISPFAGRIDDYIRKENKVGFKKTDYFPAAGMQRRGRILHDNGIVSGINLVAQCVEIIKRYKLSGKVLAASLRNPRQVREAALAGADIATIPFGVIGHLLSHPKTFEGMKRFTADIVPEYANLLRK